MPQAKAAFDARVNENTARLSTEVQANFRAAVIAFTDALFEDGGGGSGIVADHTATISEQDQIAMQDKMIDFCRYADAVMQTQ